MLLYLVQHGESKTEEEDPEQGLTETGFQNIRKTAGFAARIGIRPDKILHSHKLRAVQTAEVLGESLDPPEGDSVVDGLAPMDDPGIWAGNLLTEESSSCMLVGHMPQLQRLSALLLTGEPERGIIALKNAGIVCLKRDDEGSWAAEWILTPEVVTD